MLINFEFKIIINIKLIPFISCILISIIQILKIKKFFNGIKEILHDILEMLKKVLITHMS